MNNVYSTILFSFTPPESFSDLVSYAALIFSGITVFISIANYRAAKKSAEAAEQSATSGSRSAKAAEQSAEISNLAIELTKEQTEYMKNDAINKYMPKFLPSTQNIYISSKIIKAPGDISTEIDKLNHDIYITNVTQGNAYMVSSWLEISQEDLLENFYKEKSPEFYNRMHKYPYDLIFQSNNDSTKSQLISNYYDGMLNFMSILKPTIDINNQISSIIKPEDRHRVYVPSYVRQVIMHILYSACENKNYVQQQNKSIIKLVINYKTGNQLDSDNYMTREYSLSFSDVDYTENPLLENLVFKASLTFKFLQDISN